MVGDDGMLMQVVADDVKKIWNEEALRGLILVSLTLQIILSLLGNLRKYNPRTLFRTILWVVYFLAYAVIPAALGITAQTALEVYSTSRSISKHHKSSTSELMSFWAPFLLLHLGGPDSINSYSLEENKYWLRHLMLVVFQSGIALYILVSSWTDSGSHLPLLSIFVYVAGCIKCSQRVQALRLGNIEYLQESMLDSDEHLQESMVGPDELEESLLAPNEHFQEPMLDPEYPSEIVQEPMHGPADQLQMFDPYRHLLETKLGSNDYLMEESQDFIVNIDDQEDALPIIHASADEDRSKDSAFEAFRLVEIELGLAYDMLYTKASVVYTFKGLILHATRVFLLLLVLVGFHFYSNKENYQAIDIAITYLLVAAEIFKEIFAVITMLRSDWTDLWLNRHKYTRNYLIFSFLKNPSKQRWSNSIAQTDLLSVILVEKPASFLPLQESFGVDEYLQNRRYGTYIEISDNLKDMIYTHFCVLCISDSSALFIHKGSFSLRENKCNTLLWSINEVEFDHSLLIWHIATALCYYSEVNVDDQFEINRIESKHISEYLVNLLISNPEMLPMGTGTTRYRDTCADAMRFFKTKGPITEKAEACRMLLEADCKELLPSSIVKGDRTKSVLYDGYRLALALREMEREPMWKVMSQVWIEMLGFAAASCRGVQHLEQLGRGGEFLSHVWLLMAHLGMTNHFQQQKGTFPLTDHGMYEMTHKMKGLVLEEMSRAASGSGASTSKAAQFWQQKETFPSTAHAMYEMTHKMKGLVSKEVSGATSGRGEFLTSKATQFWDKYRVAMIEKYGLDTSTHPVEDIEIWDHCASGKIKTKPFSIVTTVTTEEPSNIVLTSSPTTLSVARPYASSSSDEVQQLKDKLRRIKEEREVEIIEREKEKAEKAEMQERVRALEQMLLLHIPTPPLDPPTGLPPASLY